MSIELQDTRPEALLGKTVAERYELLEVIGQGGIGVVYKARHTLMDRLVAIKMLRSESLKDERNRQRFQQEAQAISSLNHPNIVSVFDFGFTPDNSAFLVMDFLDGKDLDSLIQESGYLTPEEVVPIFTQICDAMTQTHEHNIIHRDLKPGNIIVLKKDNKPQAKLVDFGMIKFDVQSGKQSQALTQPGEVFGSPYYMSPEQCTGIKLDVRTDIYSMGVLMYEAVTGRPPFLANNMAEMAQMHIYEKPQPIGKTINDPEFPQWMENIIFKALEKNVNDRYQSTDELKEALLAFNKFWLEKTGGESKPISLRQTTTSRRMKDEVMAAVKAAAAKQAAQEKARLEEPKPKPKGQAAEPSPQALRASTSFLNKPIILLAGGVLIGCGLAFSLFMLFGSPKNSAKRWQDMDEAGQMALLSGNLSEAEYDFNQAVRLAEKTDDLKNPAIYGALTGLASVYERQGKYEMAENVYLQTLERIEKNNGKESANLAPVLLKMGKLYCRLNRLKEAESMHQRAMKIVDDTFGGNDVHMADCLSDYAGTKRKLGLESEAKEMEAKAERIRQEHKSKSAGN